MRLFARTLPETATRQRDKLAAVAIKGRDDERAGRSRPNLVTRPDPTTALKESELRPQSGRLFHTYYRLSTTSLCRSTADSGRRRLCQHGRPTALPPSIWRNAPRNNRRDSVNVDALTEDAGVVCGCGVWPSSKQGHVGLPVRTHCVSVRTTQNRTKTQILRPIYA